MRVPMVRNVRQQQVDELKIAIETGDMNEAMDALNFLQEVPLRIDRYCLEALLWAVEDIPNRADKIEGFPKLDEVDELTWPDDIKLDPSTDRQPCAFNPTSGEAQRHG